jgi:hypothetical protein
MTEKNRNSSTNSVGSSADGARTKTFNHPLGLTSAFGDLTGDERGEYEIFSRDEGLHRFPVAEWDIEVTFTKKVKPLPAGTVVRYSRWGQEDYTVTVLAFHDGAYWVQHEDGAYTTVAADDLIR